MAQLALDHVPRHAFARHFDGMGVAQLVRSEPAPDARFPRQSLKLASGRRAGPLPRSGWPADDAEHRTDQERRSVLKPGTQLLPAPLVHADFTTLSALALTDDERAVGRI
jgi:hypothetical protein